MKVAFIHYHLKPGGVTTVIRQQVEALRKTGGEALVFADASPGNAFPAETIAVSGLGYSREPGALPRGKSIAEKIIAAIARRWPGGCDVVHVHNPTLAKNARFTDILDALQKKGHRLLLQLHDFAEDGRPEVYSHAPYPENCHYSVINSRDYRFLLEAGLKKEGLHLLPNMVSPLKTGSNKPATAPFVLYPVRAIRRKNIGEALLLSLFFKAGHHLAITLPPNSPMDMIAYNDWVLFSKRRHLPVRFGAGLQDDFRTLAAATCSFMTTSITEGFGFSFLESWTAEKSLRGRKLPDICSDFEAKGISLNNMYSRLLVPMDWIDRKCYLGEWRKTVGSVSRRFKYAPPLAMVSEAENGLAGSSEIDFGLLNEKFQKDVLLRLIERPQEKNVLVELNPFLEELEDLSADKNRIQKNRNAVLSEYNAAGYQTALGNIYKEVAENYVCHSIHKKVLLDRFFNPKDLSLLKWAPYKAGGECEA